MAGRESGVQGWVTCESALAMAGWVAAPGMVQRVGARQRPAERRPHGRPDWRLDRGTRPERWHGAASGRNPPLYPRSPSQLLLQQLIELRGISLPLGRLHHLPDKEPKQLVLARPILGELPRILGHDVFNGAFDSGVVGDLLEPLLLDDGIRGRAARPHRLEHLFGDLARDRLVRDALEQPRQPRSRELPGTDL